MPCLQSGRAVSPSKSMQYRVYGRVGYVTDGPGYNAMVSLIRSAARDSRAGRDEEALVKIDKVSFRHTGGTGSK